MVAEAFGSAADTSRREGLSLRLAGVHHVHGAAQSRVKGTHEPPGVHRAFRVGHGQADQRFLHGAPPAAVVAGEAFHSVAGRT